MIPIFSLPSAGKRSIVFGDMKVRRRFCGTCQGFKRFEKERVNHLLHLILTFVTVGCWLLVWLTLVVLNWLKPYRCQSCGGAKLL